MSIAVFKCGEFKFASIYSIALAFKDTKYAEIYNTEISGNNNTWDFFCLPKNEEN